jgi:hypothetical protein
MEGTFFSTAALLAHTKISRLFDSQDLWVFQAPSRGHSILLEAEKWFNGAFGAGGPY